MVPTELASWLRLVARRALCNLPTIFATYWDTRACLSAGILGDLVECGVFAGAQPAVMARACLDANALDRRVHLFDSFVGIPHAGPKDIEIRKCIGDAGDGRLISSGVSAYSLEDVQQNMAEWGIPPEMLAYHPGWFQETMPTAAISAIALLRLDGDLYESTLVCLRHLYPKLSMGGWCIIDDYALDGCQAAVREYLGGLPGPLYWQKA